MTHRGIPHHSRLSLLVERSLAFCRWLVERLTVARVLGGLLLTAAAPVLALLYLVVWLRLGKPAVVRRELLGAEGNPFLAWEFRTDQSPLSKLLSRYHLHELPRLWNVLRGEMVLVGPRPECPLVADEMQATLRCYRQRMAVAPGLTGLAQVRLNLDPSTLGRRRELSLDLAYVQRRWVGLDARILLAATLQWLAVPRCWATTWCGLEHLSGATLGETRLWDAPLEPRESRVAA